MENNNDDNDDNDNNNDNNNKVKIHADYYTSTTEDKNLYAYALTVKITVSGIYDAEGNSDNAIFVFQRGVPKMNDKSTRDLFINIATPLDMQELPVNEPDLDNNIPFYRLDEVTLWFRCIDDMYKVREDIDNDIRKLVISYRFLNEDSYINNSTDNKDNEDMKPSWSKDYE
jgi:hypothetical protein